MAKTQTIKQWLRELPEPYRTAALRNATLPRDEVSSLSAAIKGGFVWDNTPEAHNFWSSVHKAVCSGGKLPPYPLPVTNPHPHAENMRLYAEDAAETDKPWERWEHSGCGQVFLGMTSHPAWSDQFQYRRKVKTIRIGDYDVPEPCREPLKEGQEFWTPASDAESPVSLEKWEGSVGDFRLLKRGMIHLTREAAETHAKALISFTERKEST